MRSVKARSQSGFTLIELLVSIGILGILSATSLQSYNAYRASAHYAIVEQLSNNARLAMQAGFTEEDRLDPSYFITTTAPGPLTAAGADEIVPGLMNQSDTYLVVYASPSCDDTDVGCLVEFIRVQHCTDHYVRSYYRFNDGVIIDQTFVSALVCP